MSGSPATGDETAQVDGAMPQKLHMAGLTLLFIIVFVQLLQRTVGSALVVCVHLPTGA